MFEKIITVSAAISMGGTMIATFLFIVAGLLLPSIILHDREEIMESEKYIEDPILLAIFTLKIIFITALFFATITTITTIIIYIL
ncbi:hypothetical protein H5991_01485 [Ligilactobacillus agilis]|uniref:hypothetical protein n=1 Tax=Ligilactobacillus agilis TaxID=1601 RepID=UPI00195BDCCC|nr:hypothetical protein [Ligilactobacillus agilis]MBM6772197.1 hypothetical protein [Ligilactobacillus agilis]